MRTLLLVLSLIPAVAFAQMINQVSLEKTGEGQIINIVIKGSSLGAKAVSIFYDQVGTAYEKGVANNFFDTFTADRQILHKDTLNNTASPWGSVVGPLYIRSDPKYSRGPD